MLCSSQSILTYGVEALLCAIECEVETLIESLNPLLLPISWEGKMRRGKSLFLAFSFKTRKGEKVCESLSKIKVIKQFFQREAQSSLEVKWIYLLYVIENERKCMLMCI